MAESIHAPHPVKQPNLTRGSGEAAGRATTLYRLFDADGALLYVGISGRWVGRLAAHARQAGWWGEVATVTRQPFPSRAEALEAEATAIRQEHPRYNVRGKPRPVRSESEERMPLAWVEYERGSLPVFGVADAHASAGIGVLDATAAAALRTRSTSP